MIYMESSVVRDDTIGKTFIKIFASPDVDFKKEAKIKCVVLAIDIPKKYVEMLDYSLNAMLKELCYSINKQELDKIIDETLSDNKGLFYYLKNRFQGDINK